MPITSKTLIGIFCMLMIALPAASSPVTPPGTEIVASAEIQFSSSFGEPLDEVNSGSAQVIIYYPADLTISEAKSYPDGQFVRLKPNVVVGGTQELGSKFYIEASDRSSAIRVDTGRSVIEGDEVVVYGRLSTNEGERRIEEHHTEPVSYHNPLPKPIGIMQRWLKDCPIDKSGLLVEVIGRVTAVPSSGHFYIDDGSALKDGSGHTGVRVYGSALAVVPENYLRIAGILGYETLGKRRVPVLRTRYSQDISKIDVSQ